MAVTESEVRLALHRAVEDWFANPKPDTPGELQGDYWRAHYARCETLRTLARSFAHHAIDNLPAEDGRQSQRILDYLRQFKDITDPMLW